MPLSRFIMADAVYAVPGVSVLFWLAYLFTDQFVMAVNQVEHQMHRPVVIVGIVSAVAGVLLYRYFTTRTLSTGDPEMIPPLMKPVGAVAAKVEHAVEVAVDATKGVIVKVTHSRGPGNHPMPVPPASGGPEPSPP